jgi:hypothetical protein
VRVPIRSTIAITALAGATLLWQQDQALAHNSTTLKAYGVSVSALGQTLAAIPVATSANPNQTVASESAGSLLNSGQITAKVSTDAAGTETATAQTANLSTAFLASTLSADAITATCTASPGSAPTGSATLANAKLVGPLGVPTTNLASNPAPNTTYGIPGVVTVTANEQITNADGSLTINALDLDILGANGGHVIVSSATCGPAVAPAPMVSMPGAALTGGLGILAFLGYRRWRSGRGQSTVTA